MSKPSRTIYITGNWKMNLLGDEVSVLISELKESLDKSPDILDNKICIIFPPQPYIALAIEETRDCPIIVGGQNIFFESGGPFTGEVSPKMLTDLGARYVLIGHSERRTHFGEDSELSNLKVKAALAESLVPILCCGETLEERERKVTEMVAVDQIETACTGLSPEEISKIIIAYEPIWAIGSGKTVTPDDANHVHKLIRKVLRRNWSEKLAEGCSVLYGGSVTPDNIKDFMKMDEIDGVLVGGASLDSKSFLKIIAYDR